MKKIGILTYHTGFNYGASLQAYALMTTVNKLVGNCEIINFAKRGFGFLILIGYSSRLS